MSGIAVGRRFKEKRQQVGLTQEEVAAAEGITQPHISAIECNSKEPSLKLLKRLAVRYQTSTDYLLGLSDDPAPGPGRASAAARTLLALFQQLSPGRRREMLHLARALRAAQEEEQRALDVAEQQALLDEIEELGGARLVEAISFLLDAAARGAPHLSSASAEEPHQGAQ